MSPHVPAGAAHPDATLLQFTTRTIWVALRCWWKTITPLGIVLAMLAGCLVFLLHKPRYTSDAWLLIKDKPDVILREVESGSQRFIQNQLEIIRSPRLLGPLAANPEIIATPELRKEQDIARALAKKLKTTPRGESDIYVVSFTSESPEKAELIVREVVSAYLAFNRKLDSEQQSQILRLLQDQREARYQEMNQLREKVRSVSMELTGVDPFRTTQTPEEQSKASSSMAALQADIIRYEVAQDILAAHIKAEEEREIAEQAEELSTEEVERIERQIALQPSYIAFRTRIDELRSQEADFRRTGKRLEQNALYRQVQSDLAAEQQAFEAWQQEQRAELFGAAQRESEVARNEKLKAFKAEFATGAARLRILNEKFEQRMGAAKRVTGDSLGLEFHRAKLEQVTKVHDEINARILALTTEQRAPERVMAFKEATLPLRPDETIPWKNIAAAAGLAFLFPFGCVVLWEHFFRRVSSRDQLEACHQLAVVGEVTELPPPGRSRGRRERQLVLFEESVDSLRTYLSLSDVLQEHRVLAVTSAISGEGKTSLAAQLARSIARASGQPTLLIDGDMRSPSLHDKFGLPRDAGLAEVLSQQCAFDDVVRTSADGQLDVLPAGRLHTSPHRLLNNGSLSRLLQELRERYCHVIVDTPPILPASEALIMARAADAAVLCMRRDYSRLDQVQETHARMTAAGVKTAGAVLNGIPLSNYCRKYGDYPYANALETAAPARAN